MENKYIDLLQSEIENDIWTGYVTYYPHKKAYKNLGVLDMKKVWQGVKELNLYVHIPFCDRKCAYCNLFSTVFKKVDRQEIYEKYVQKVLKEIQFYGKSIDKNIVVKSLYFGGGTPVVLTIEQLERIVNEFHNILPNWSDDIEACIECSPELLNYEYLEGLKKIGFKRVSIGIQSFVQKELDLVGRNISTEQTESIINIVKQSGLNFNLDLIYGLPNQTEQSILKNLDKAINFNPDSICIYPLAIREGTGISYMDKNTMFSMGQKYQMFDKLRDVLEKHGYECQTVVRFIKSQKSTYQQQRLEYEGIPTLSVGAGARSYTDNLSYCLTYKVNDRLVQTIIKEYLETDIDKLCFDGFEYDKDEEKRKYVMLNLLDPKVYECKYFSKFGSLPQSDFAMQFEALKSLDLIYYDNEEKSFALTKKGRKYCDIAVDIFVSDKVRQMYKNYKVE